MRILHAIAILAAVSATALPVGATPDEALSRFEEGRALVKNGRPADAISQFLASLRARRTPAALINLADAYERVGKLASAQARFLEAAEMTRQTEPHRAAEAERRALALAPRLSTITVVAPATVRVLIDERPIDPSSFGSALPFDAGRHDIVVVRSNGQREASVIALDGEAAHVAFTAEDVTPVPPARPETAPNVRGSNALRVIGVTTAGIGFASIVAGGVLGIVALDKSSELKSACPGYPTCPLERQQELETLRQDARSLGDASTITIVAGAGAVALGVVLYLVGRGSTPARPTASAMSVRW